MVTLKIASERKPVVFDGSLNWVDVKCTNEWPYLWEAEVDRGLYKIIRRGVCYEAVTGEDDEHLVAGEV